MAAKARQHIRTKIIVTYEIDCDDPEFASEALGEALPKIGEEIEPGVTVASVIMDVPAE
jgi:hypothetical protein